MNIQHLNMKYICERNHQWMTQHMAHLGVFDFGCSYIDFRRELYLPVPSDHKMYCVYLESKLHLRLEERLKVGLHVWKANSCLNQTYYKLKMLPPEQRGFPIDWTVKTEHGFNHYYFVTHQPLQAHQTRELALRMRQHAEAVEVLKNYKAKALIEIPSYENLQQRFYAGEF